MSLIGWATKALYSWQSGEFWSSRHLVNVGCWIVIGIGYSLDLDCRLDFGSLSSFILITLELTLHYIFGFYSQY